MQNEAGGFILRFISEYSVVRAVQRKIHVIITAFYYSNYVLKIS